MTKFGQCPAVPGRSKLAALAVIGAVVSAPMPLWAQSTAPDNGVGAANTSGNGASTGTVGPDALRNFSLGRPATEQAAPPVQPDLVPTTRRPLPTNPSNTSPARTAPRETGSRPVIQPNPAPREAPAPRPADVRPAPTPVERTAIAPASSVTVALPPADPLARRPTPAIEGDIPRMSSQPIGNAGLSPAEPLPDDKSGSLLPWILALLAIGGGVLAYAFRGRFRASPLRMPALATGPLPLPRELPPRSFPPAPPPPPQGTINVRRPDPFALEPSTTPPAITTARPAGIVSTRLRPWLEIEFEPTRAVIDDNQASVMFDIIVTNSGNAPARQVLVEACMVNAGPEQDAELRRFFDAPVGMGDRIAMIPPLGKIALKSAVSLLLDQVRGYEVGGRRLFVPLVAFNALYEWGSSQGQSSAAYILGRSTSTSEGDGERDGRMAPLRLDLGPRIFRGLEGRRHPLGMRR